MRERFLNNLGLKLLSILAAFILWITIINVIDPSTPKTIYNIPVNIINTDALTELGYTFEVIDGSTVTIVVDGPISKTDGLTASDFYASADLSTISSLSDYVDIDVVCIKSTIFADDLTITLKTPSVKLNVENRETISMNVSAVFSGEPADGYVVGDYEVSPMSIKITGAESIVEGVAYVAAEYDVEGALMDISDTVSLKLYDEDGNKIDTSNLVLSKENVKLKVPILVEKTIPVNYAYTGTVRDGYKIAGITSTINEVTIAGTSSVIAGIESIDIPAELIDVSDLDGTSTFAVRLSHYISSGIKILSDVSAEVTVDVQQTTTQTIDIPTSDISLVNTNDQYDYEFMKDSITVTFSGLKADLEQINLSDIKASVDVSGLTTGTKTVKLYAGSVNNCNAVGEYTLSISISKK